MNQRVKNRIIDYAKRLATSNIRTGRSLHFSFILRKDTILVYGINHYRKSPLRGFVYKTTKITDSDIYLASLHSEVSALRTFINKFGHNDMSKLVLFNVRIGYELEVMNSQPCKNCYDYVVDPLNWKNVYWT